MSSTHSKSFTIRGHDTQQAGMFSYLSPEERVPVTHPLRPIRQYVDTALTSLSPQVTKLYARTGRPSIAPEKFLRALLLQVLYSLRSKRLLMEELQYNLLFRWFVGLDLDVPVWDVTVFTKNQDRLLACEMATAFFEQVLAQAKSHHLLSDKHFTFDGTLIEAWPGQKSFKQKTNAAPVPPTNDPGNPSVGFRGERRTNATHALTTDPEAQLYKSTRVEQIFGWLKTVGLLRKVKLRGVRWIGWLFTFAAAAYSLVRMLQSPGGRSMGRHGHAARAVAHHEPPRWDATPAAQMGFDGLCDWDWSASVSSNPGFSAAC